MHQQQQKSGSQTLPDSPLQVPRPPAVPWEDIILFQAFGWESSKQGGSWYDTVLSRFDDIAASGATHVWLNPPSKSVSKEGYLPSQLYDLRSAYGDRDSLIRLNTALFSAGIRPIADIVINHRCADEQDSNGLWNTFRDDIGHPGRRIDWGPWAITRDDGYGGKGAHDTGEDYGPSPDIDHSNAEVQAGIVDWLVWLRQYIGFEGWRLDFAKGFGPQFAKHYIEETLDAGKSFCVGELWAEAEWNGASMGYNQDAMRQKLCDWLDGVQYSAAFDFTTKAQLQEAVKHCEYDRLRDAQGKPPGLLGWWPQRAVTFIDNHDTGSTQRHWPFPDGATDLGYAYILTHPGIPCIFWEHFFDPKLQGFVVALVALRQRAGIRADSKIEILAAEKDLYVARIAGTVVLKLGPRFKLEESLLPRKEDGWTLVLAGKDWAVWELTTKS